MEVSEVVRPADTLAGALAAAASLDHGLEALTRRLLDLVGQVTGLESTYLTRIDWDADLQEVLFARNVGGLVIPEALQVTWSDTLCKRALAESRPFTDNVPEVWGDSEAARALGLQTYLSFPVITSDGEVYGTLCGASGERRSVGEAGREMLQLCARLIADQVAREQRIDHERARAEQAEIRLRARAKFLAKAEHELKTPLTVVLGWSGMLATGWDRFTDEERKAYAGHVHRYSVELQTQIDRMLEEARAEVLARDLILVPLDVAERSTSIVEAFSNASTAHTVRADVPLDPVRALADPDALYQIVGHLLENAIKHSPAGCEIVVRVRAGDGGVRIDVDDDGPGLPEGVDVFAAFTRGDTSASKGVGLGLHIVRSLAEAMNGSVSAGATNSGGARFTVTLPAAR